MVILDRILRRTDHITSGSADEESLLGFASEAEEGLMTIGNTSARPSRAARASTLSLEADPEDRPAQRDVHVFRVDVAVDVTAQAAVELVLPNGTGDQARAVAARASPF